MTAEDTPAWRVLRALRAYRAAWESQAEPPPRRLWSEAERHITEAVSDRLAGPLTGAQVTVAGQTVELAETEDEARLGQTLSSIARAMGAPEEPSPANDDGWPGTKPWT